MIDAGNGITFLCQGELTAYHFPYYILRCMSLSNKSLRKFSNLFNRLWHWYYHKYVSDDRHDNDVALEDLKWLPKTLRPNKNEPFGLINTIQFDIQNIPMDETVIFEMVTENQARNIVECVARTK